MSNQDAKARKQLQVKLFWGASLYLEFQFQLIKMLKQLLVAAFAFALVNCHRDGEEHNHWHLIKQDLLQLPSDSRNEALNSLLEFLRGSTDHQDFPWLNEHCQRFVSTLDVEGKSQLAAFLEKADEEQAHHHHHHAHHE